MNQSEAFIGFNISANSSGSYFIYVFALFMVVSQTIIYFSVILFL